MLLVGLGNPGSEYEGTRHNIGFLIVDAIRSEYGFSKPVKKFGADYSDGVIAGVKIHSIKPLKFMNNSGAAVSEAAGFYKSPLSEVVVIHDDLDIALGRVKIKTGGGDGGHNGLKSIDSHLGKDYQRIRVGIGHPGDKDMVSGYVLSNFAKTEKKKVKNIIEILAEKFAVFAEEGREKFLSQVATGFQEAGINEEK